MICSYEYRFFMPNLRSVGDWTPKLPATQNRWDVGPNYAFKPTAGCFSLRPYALASGGLTQALAVCSVGVLCCRHSQRGPRTRGGVRKAAGMAPPVPAPEQAPALVPSDSTWQARKHVRRSSQRSNYSFKPTAESWSLRTTAVVGAGLAQAPAYA